MDNVMETQTASSFVSPAPDKPAFAVTDAALGRISKILQGEPEGSYFRISVLGGGCSGFQYHFDFDASPLTPEDFVIGQDEIKVVIDDVSLNYLAGSVLDYIETLGSAGFEIKNPNATAKCGCGNSFSM
jgi:iron-sulfur cluster assembly accessory protein